MWVPLAKLSFDKEFKELFSQEEDVRHTLQDFAESYGLKIDRSLGPKHKQKKRQSFSKKRPGFGQHQN